jgi:hypothetical protein
MVPDALYPVVFALTVATLILSFAISGAHMRRHSAASQPTIHGTWR